MENIKNFYNTADLNKNEFSYLIDLALKMKKGKIGKQLCGKTLAMLFFNFMWPTENFLASSTNEAPICFWVCRLISQVMRFLP